MSEELTLRSDEGVELAEDKRMHQGAPLVGNDYDEGKSKLPLGEMK